MEIAIDGRLIGTGHPTYIVAELSANHAQRIETAEELVRAAKDAGADAVKLQTYTADTITIDCDSPMFRISHGTIWDGRTLYELYREAHMPWDWQIHLMRLASDIGISLFSSPFDETAVNFLEGLSVPAYKIASFEIVDIPLLKRVAMTGKPIIISTGMADLSEIALAVETLQSNGCRQFALLKCASAYPAPPESLNLRTIPDLIRRFQVPCGLSDHTLTSETAIASVCLGGTIIEKHLTLDRGQGGPDAKFSVEPDEFRKMVESVRIAEQSLGAIHYGPTMHDIANRDLRPSLFAVKNVAGGETFSERNVRSIRPGHGLHPKFLDRVLGQRARHDIPRGTPLSWSDIG
jgi:pseudaminic acid synthase